MFLYGGKGDNYAYYGDLWEWNGSAWTKRFAIPPTLSGHAMAFDSRREIAVIFGGLRTAYGEFNPFRSDTWELDGTNWFLRSTTGPSPRRFHAMAYDTRRAVTVLVGGYAQGTGRSGETWEWDGISWTLRASGNTLMPYGHAMAYDSSRDRTVLFGGGYDTWEWDGNSWTHPVVTPSPSFRDYLAMAYDSRRDRTVLFGGTTGPSQFFGDTWEWDGTNWTMRSLSGPPPRASHTMAYDSVRGATVLFGGYSHDSMDHYYADTWEWDGNSWIQQSASGPPASKVMTYDTARGRTVAFGDDNEQGDETWVYGDPPCPNLIADAPVSPLVCQNSAVSLRTIAPGATSFKWQKLGVNLADAPTMLGTQTDTLVFTQVQPTDSGAYHCVVKLDGCGTSISNAGTLTVFPTGSADGNADGLLDARDIQPFVDQIVNFAPVSPTLCAYDLTGDGVVDLADLDAFVARLLNG